MRSQMNIMSRTSFKKLSIFITFPILIVSFCLPFVAGKYSNDSKIEEISQFTSEIVKYDTANSNYLAITVAATNKSDPIAYHEYEFYNLYGTFKQEQASFGSGINFFDKEKNDKKHSIFIKDYNNEVVSSNLSLFFLRISTASV